MLSAWYFSIPAVTRWLFTGMSGLLLITWLTATSDFWCMDPFGFPTVHSLMTMVTSTYTHLSFFHLFWNMSVLVHYGCIYELKWGSMKFFLNVVVFGLLCNVVQILSSYGLYLMHSVSLMPYIVLQKVVYACSLGFSGVLFAFISIDCFDPQVQPTEGLQVFGLMPVPKKYYPWIMLALMQLMLQNVSFLGHLGGITIGLLYARDSYRLLHIKRYIVEFLESMPPIQLFLANRPMWIPKNKLPGNDAPPPITFTQALQQQFQSMYASRSPPPEPRHADRALPVNATGSSNITSFSQLPRSSDAHSSSSSSQATHSSHSTAKPTPFPGEGHTLGGR